MGLMSLEQCYKAIEKISESGQLSLTKKDGVYKLEFINNDGRKYLHSHETLCQCVIKIAQDAGIDISA